MQVETNLTKTQFNIIFIRPFLTICLFAIPSLMVDTWLIDNQYTNFYIATTIYYAFTFVINLIPLADVIFTMSDFSKTLQLAVICLSFAPTIYITNSYGFLLLTLYLILHGFFGYMSYHFKYKTLVQLATTLEMFNKADDLENLQKLYDENDFPPITYGFYPNKNIKFVSIEYKGLYTMTLHFLDKDVPSA